MSAFPRSCLHLSPIVSPHVCLCWMMCLPSRCLVSPLSPNVSHCLPALCACVGWCVRLPEVLSPLLYVSPLSRLPTCVPVMVCLPSLVSSCLPLSAIVSPHMCACVGWCVRLPEVLSPLVSHWLPTMVCPPSPRSCFPVSAFYCLPCLPSCFFFRLGWCVRLLGVLSPLVSHCFPFSPIVSSHVCLCWMVCPPSRGLVSHCLPLSPSHVCLCWMVYPLPRASCLRLQVGHCLPLSPHVCLCWMVCPPSRWSCLRLVSHCLPYMCACVGCLVSPLALSSAFPRSCLLLSPIVSPHVCLCWMVRRLPEVLSPLVSHCLPSCFLCVADLEVCPHCSHCLPFLSPLSPSLSPSLSSFLSPACLPTCLSSCFPLWWVV